MTPIEILAAMLDGIEYRELSTMSYKIEYGRIECKQYPKHADAIEYAERNHLTIVYGYSDDLMEFEGEFFEEYGAWNGETVYGNNGQKIEMTWNDSDPESVWHYEVSGCEYRKFMIFEDGERYGDGIVIDAPGVKWKPKEDEK